ncbi:ATP-dependent nuclease [Yoonia litorea]|uniref:Predicted ATP-dependent endonuclease of the OLD family, contains P-loop ATPase and TOPRIM domains n=1 Tax=Yoonia litorea TaxID=1123755 RepID=A0A1I6MWG7_9RHOB|nr:AAA family ATPase [Yoonia litorea]SFS20050.1 Predicted ATP-dependent endonuclease of the OLD family, contains P-loop ATPase and TOPRIM domains [Yoonia litorea]
MSLRITKIDIRNFRSVRNLSLSPSKLAVLVGKNDSGKSNVLRALNLFFNGKTMPADDLEFDTDHNVFNQPNRRAKEISIKLEIAMPESYRETNGDFVVWERRWRSEGRVFDEYSGRRKVAGPRGGASLETVDIPDRSNVHALLRNINYVYVPAIKDLEYFSELRASIYDIIAEVADREFRNSSQDFEQSISDQLQDLTTQITASLGFRSRLALPKDLSHIFESLDFLSEGQDISLDSRGDGIKARHIPLILKFMADKKRRLQVRGSAPHTFIWGYEEPENNLELSSCVELADQFWGFVDNGVSQIFLTTHSPVFYNLHRKQEEGGDRITCHHIFREVDAEGTKEATELGDLDDRMGTTALFAPMVTELEDRVRRQEQARAEVEQLAQANRRKLFVEGPSDKLIVDKALAVFAPDRVGEIDVETRESAGINYVIDMLRSWRSRAKHHPELPRAAGLLDLDPEAKTASKLWNEVPDNIKSAKCFKLPTPPHIVPIFQAGLHMPVVLECLYDRQAWEWAEGRGHLKPRHLPGVIPAELNQRIVAGETTLDDNLDDDWAIFVKREFEQGGKRPMAQHYANKEDDDFRGRMPFMENLINEIVGYLFPEQEQPAVAADDAQPGDGEHA